MAEVKKIRCRECEICRSGIFNDLEAELLPLVEDHIAVQQFQPGQIICAEGMPPWGVYCIREGSVKVFRTGERGEIQILRLRRAGEAIGLRSLSAAEPFTCSVEALEKTVVCVLPRDFCLDLIRRSEVFAAAIMVRLARNQRRIEDLMMSLTQRSARRRLAHLLLYLEGISEDGSQTVSSWPIRLKRMEMAQMIGVSSETLSRTLRKFVDEGLVHADRKAIVLRDPATLTAIATRSRLFS